MCTFFYYLNCLSRRTLLVIAVSLCQILLLFKFPFNVLISKRRYKSVKSCLILLLWGFTMRKVSIFCTPCTNQMFQAGGLLVYCSRLFLILALLMSHKTGFFIKF